MLLIFHFFHCNEQTSLPPRQIRRRNWRMGGSGNGGGIEKSRLWGIGKSRNWKYDEYPELHIEFCVCT